MTAAAAAVEILKRESVSHLFGVPGAAINPFYAAVRAEGGLQHVLARHVEGAAHVAEGYTRARAGNIGVCVGTSGPGGTDMITGMYSAVADSVPILCITGQVPVVAVAERCELSEEQWRAAGFAGVYALTDTGASLAQCLTAPGPLLERLGARIAAEHLDAQHAGAAVP